jgi:hypothetical protein
MVEDFGISASGGGKLCGDYSNNFNGFLLLQENSFETHGNLTLYLST